MSTIKILKKQAKSSLNDKWFSAVAGLLTVFSVLLFVYLFYAMLGFITGAFTEAEEGVNNFLFVKLIAIFCLTSLLFTSLLPITNGFFKLCYDIACGRGANFENVFYFFKGTKQYFNAIVFNIFICVKLFFAYFLFFSIDKIIKLSINQYTTEHTILQALLFAFGVIAAIFLLTKILFSEFVFVDNENAPISYISRSTRIIFKHHRLDILLLNYSFIPWIALCFLVIPALYVIPYMSTTFATSAKWLLKLYKEGKMV